MSLRTAIRRFASSARTHLPSAEPTPAPASGFSAIRDLLSSPSSIFDEPAASSSKLALPSDATPSTLTPARGYSPDALPPKADPSLEMLTNCLMKDGKKGDAEKMVSRVLGLLHASTNLPPQPLVRQAILLSSPSIKILSMRKSAKTVLSPRALTERQRTRQGIAWILKAAEKGRKGGVSRDQRIAREVLAVLEGQSDVFKWLEERHKVAYLNRSNMTAR
ncbi:hypothetical protein IAU60_000879 [Kwoniella sp. DSM 27419]